MADDINYCPKCATGVDVLGTDIEDREICDCPECGIVEIVYYPYVDPDPEWLDRIRNQ